MNDDQIDHVFKAMADPTRRRIMASLMDRPDQSLFEICAGLHATTGRAMSRQTVSQHLDMLDRASLLVTRWQGRTKLHSLDPEPLRAAARETLSPWL